MKPIFAPWRMEYITSRKKPGCVFCDLPGLGVGEESLVLGLNDHAYVVLNRYPYVSGHVMVIPYRHVEDPLDLTPEEWRAMNDLVRPVVRALRNEYRPHGFNIGMNVGVAAGAGIHEHIHAHVIPRWTGDNNLISVLTDTRVIPESLSETWRRLEPAFRTVHPCKEGETR